MSTLIESKADFQSLAEQRLIETKALLDLELWDGAYYLAGYAVELALKACIIKMMMETDAFPDKRFSENCYTHDVRKLIVVAKLESLWDAARADNPILAENWLLAVNWSEQKRYHRISRIEAEELYAAIVDDEHGVFPWFKTHW